MTLPLGDFQAPKRGRYDRALSRHERQAAQQERVVAAIAALAAQAEELSVANIVESAGIGRNTFYEYFDDVAHAVAAINARACRDLLSHVELALRSTRTPIERVRTLARIWVENLAQDPAVAALALRVNPPSHISVLSQCFLTVLTREVEASGPLPGLADQSRTIAVAAVFDALSRRWLSERQPDNHLQCELSELALRLLR